MNHIDKKLALAVVGIIVSLLILSMSFILLLYQIQTFPQISPPTEWRTLYSVTEPSGKWTDVESVAIGVVKDSIYFKICWQAGFPKDAIEGDPRGEQFWRQDRGVHIEWTIQTDNYSLDLYAPPPSPETGKAHLFTELQSSVSPRFRIVYESANLTDGIVGLQLLNSWKIPLAINWEESENFLIYGAISETRHYNNSSRFSLSDIPVITSPPTIDGDINDWQGSDRLIWNLTAHQSQAANLLQVISLVRSNIGVHMLLEFQTSYLDYLQGIFPGYILYSQLLANFIAIAESENIEHDYNFNVLTKQSRSNFTADITHYWNTGAEEFSVSSSDFAVNQSIELTYRNTHITDIWESDKIWKISVGIGRFLWLYKLLE